MGGIKRAANPRFVGIGLENLHEKSWAWWTIGPSRGKTNEFRHVLELKLLFDVRSVSLDGAMADAKLLRDAPRIAAFSNVLQHLEFAIC